MQLHERLYEIVAQSGMTQRDFAELMGVAVSAQRNYEKGLNKPNTAYLTRLYEAGFDVVYLLTGERSVARLSQAESELLTVWRQADLARQFAAYNALVGTAAPPDWPKVETMVTVYDAEGKAARTDSHGNRIGDITASTIKNITQGK